MPGVHEHPSDGTPFLLFPTLKSKTTQEVQFLAHFLLKCLLKYFEYILVSFLSPKENERKLKTSLLTRIKYLPLLQVKRGVRTTEQRPAASSGTRAAAGGGCELPRSLAGAGACEAEREGGCALG